MNRTLWKDTLRLIRNQKGRYLAFVLIVMIGTSFYTGVTASSTMMAQNVDAYNDSLNLKDITIYSNYGFDEDDVAAVAALSEVESAEGSKFADVMASDGTTASITRIHSLTQDSQINNFILVEGRYPQNDKEVLSEHGNDMNPGFAVGSELTLTRPDDDLGDWISTDTVTVVGSVDTPVYLNMTKENSTLGNQYIGTYLYMNESAFTSEYYTELNVTTANGKSFNSFYQPYMDYISGVVEDIETLAETQTVKRKQAIYDEAVRKYNEGYQEYQDGLEKYNTEIADAEKKLTDAFNKIKDGYVQIAASQAKIDAGRRKLKAELNGQSVQSINDGIAQIDAAVDQLSQAKSGYAQINDALEQIDNANKALPTASRVTNELLKAVPELKDATIGELKDFISSVIERYPSSEDVSKYISERIEESGVIAKYLGDADKSKLREYIETSDMSKLTTYVKETLADTTYLELLELTEGSTLGDLNNALAELPKKLEDTKAELEAQKKQIVDSLAEQGMTVDDIDAKLEELGKKRAELVEAAAKVSSAQAELDYAQKKLDAAKKKLDAGYKEYLASEAEFEKKKADAWQKLEDAKAELDAAWDKIQGLESCTWTVLDRSKHYASETFKNTVKQMKAIADIFPVFFLLVAALVCLTTMTRMVDEERGQIGIMRALGYTQLQCAFRYLFYAGSAAILGCILGAAFGMVTFPVIIYNAWKMMYVLPPMKIYISWAVIFKASLAFFVVIILTTWFTCERDMKEVPSQLLRPKSPKLGRKTLLERITFIWSRFSFTWKVTARNLIRYKKRLAMTIVGVAGCTALLVIGFGVKDSISSMVSLQFDELMHYDGSAVFEDELTVSEKQALANSIEARDDVSDVHLINGYSTLVTVGKDEETSNLYVFDDNKQVSQVFTLRTRRGHEPVELTDDGVIVNEKLAENLGLSVGDTMTVESKTGLKRDVRISGIFEMYIQHYVLMSKEYYSETFGTAAGYNEILIQESEGADNPALQTDLLNINEIASISFVDSILANFQTMVDSLDLIVWVLIFSSMALAFVVLGNLTNINISERQREIATLKVLGFRPKEVQSYIYNENNILTFVGALCGMPIGNILHHYIMRQVEMDYVMFGRSVLPQSFVYSVLITVLFGLLVNYFMRKRLASVLMVESLKSVE